MDRISLRTLIIGLLLAVVFSAVIHAVVSQYQLRSAALEYHAKSMSRVVEVAAQEVLRQARAHAIGLGNSMQQRLALNDREYLRQQLDEPFSRGYGEASALDLEALRVYDPAFTLLATSGRRDIPTLPTALLQRAAARQGVERLKAVGGLWTVHNGPLYSVLIPVGGLHVEGYLEVVFDPLYNLRNVGDMINMPFGIYGIHSEELLHPVTIDRKAERYAAVEYVLRDVADNRILRLAAYADVAQLHGDTRRTQAITTLSFFAVATLVLLLALHLLQRHLFQPVQSMIDGMDQALHNANHSLPIHQGIKEVRVVANAFNVMAARVRGNIQELRQLSAIDGLTGIANRRTFTQTLEREWLQALHQNIPLSLLLIDVDHFKQFNDHYGHQAGDTCLVDIACALSLTVLRPSDLVARYGGEEFVVLLPDTDLEGAAKVAAKLQQVVATLAIPHQSSSTAAVVTMSIGVSTLTPTPDQLSRWLVAGADLALYRAKAAGRNRIELVQDSDWVALHASVTPPENS